MSIKIIATKETSPGFAAWLQGSHKELCEENNRLKEQATQTIAFLEKTAKAHTERWSKHWEDLFIKMQEEGRFDKNARYKDWGITIDDETNTLFFCEVRHEADTIKSS